MDQVIIYPHEVDGISTVAVVWPNLGCGLTIEEIAAKDVPPDTPYKIIPASDVPTDLMFRNAWEYQP